MQTIKKSEAVHQKTVYKGVFIANQRRKQIGGRIKCETFDCKIQVNDFNPAIHESQVQWVQIRRYIKGEKRQFQTDKNRGKQKNISNQTGYYQNKNNKDIKNSKKYVELSKTVEKDFNQGKDQQKHYQNKQISPKTEVLNKIKITQISQNKLNSNQQYKQKTQNDKKVEESNNKSQQFSQLQLINPMLQKELNQNTDQTKNNQKQLIQDISMRNQDDIQTESEKDNSDSQNQDQITQTIKKQQTSKVINSLDKKLNLPIKQKSEKDKQIEPSKQKKQEIIVARIIKQTNIIYKQKKFVGILILTHKNKRDLKNSFIQKNIKPITKIIQDYYLDVIPIHSRLPKMQIDTLVPENIDVLHRYIGNIYLEKGNQLNSKILNQILDHIQSIYVVVSFGLWEKNRPYANIHQIIGKTMTIDGQCNCFLFEHHLNDFHYVQAQISQEQQKIIEMKPSEYHKQFNKMVFSIDPQTSIDLDDAISIEKVNDFFQIGIHIADVSEYLKYIQRKQLMKRTTSVYLPHKVFHMLTPQLMKITSLNPNVERLAFSIYVQMSLEGDIVGESRIEKNIIKNKFKLSYETVQDIITAKTNFKEFLQKYPTTQVQDFELLVEKLQILTKIGCAHRSKRIQFEVFQNRQIKFSLDQDKWPINISVESRFTSKKIVEEYMIIGNVQAAKHLIKHNKQNALIIYHPMPSDLAINHFNQTFKFLSKPFSFHDISAIQNQFFEIQNDPNINNLIKQYIYFKGRRMQQNAGYKLYHEAVKDILQKNKKDQTLKDELLELRNVKNVHFALGEEFYTHFTSPMRRMADILVHETLNSIIYKTEPKLILQEEIEKINLGRKHTKRLKRDITEMYICLMIHKTGKIIKEKGLVTSFGLKSVSIYIPFFDMMKEIMWRDELNIHKVSKNRTNQQILDVCIYYDKRSAAKDVIWQAKKFDEVGLIINCSKRPPLRLLISLEVISTKAKKQIIQADSYDE